MAFDFALHRETGDFIFGPTRDLIGVTGEELDKQRIRVRLKIPRGTFIYDEDGTLGSNLHRVSRNPSSSAVAEARGYISEALDEMEAVSIGEISVEVNDYGRLTANVAFTQIGAVESELADDDTAEDIGELPEFDASIDFSSELE